MGFGSTVITVAAGPVAAAKALGDIIGNLNDIAKGVTAMNDQFTQMRGEIADLNDHVVGLRDEMSTVRRNVVDINGKWDVLDEKLDELSTTLHNVDALASRFARFGRKAS